MCLSNFERFGDSTLIREIMRNMHREIFLTNPFKLWHFSAMDVQWQIKCNGVFYAALVQSPHLGADRVRFRLLRGELFDIPVKSVSSNCHQNEVELCAHLRILCSIDGDGGV